MEQYQSHYLRGKNGISPFNVRKEGSEIKNLPQLLKYTSLPFPLDEILQHGAHQYHSRQTSAFSSKALQLCSVLHVMLFVLRVLVHIYYSVLLSTSVAYNIFFYLHFVSLLTFSFYLGKILVIVIKKLRLIFRLTILKICSFLVNISQYIFLSNQCQNVAKNITSPMQKKYDILFSIASNLLFDTNCIIFNSPFSSSKKA